MRAALLAAALLALTAVPADACRVHVTPAGYFNNCNGRTTDIRYGVYADFIYPDRRVERHRRKR